MDLGIRGRKAIVNGGSAGMGRGSVLALAREGCELYVSARRKERLERTCAAIARETGARVTPICADHSTDEGRGTILAACPEPDILVGTCSPPPFTGDYRTVTIKERYNALTKANGTTYEEEIQKFIDAWRIPANRKNYAARVPFARGANPWGLGNPTDPRSFGVTVGFQN